MVAELVQAPTAKEPEILVPQPHDPRGYALAYFDLGWSPIPVKVTTATKKPAIGSVTGFHGVPLTRDELTAMVAGERVTRTVPGFEGTEVSWWNDLAIGLRLPDGIIGIDVDHYGNKFGGDQLAEMEAVHGKLPATVIVTARPNDQLSGIRLFRVPPGLNFKDPSADVDVIQRHHRFVTAWPTMHKSGGQYGWYTHDWQSLAVPALDSPLIVDLPEAWVTFLSTGPASAPNRAKRPNPAELDEWLAKHSESDGTYGLADALAVYARCQDRGQDRHTAHFNTLKDGLRAALLGKVSAEQARADAWSAHENACDESRPPRSDEWDDISDAISYLGDGGRSDAVDTFLSACTESLHPGLLETHVRKLAGSTKATVDDTVQRVLWAAVRDMAAGLYPGSKAVERIRKTYDTVRGADGGEFDTMLMWAVRDFPADWFDAEAHRENWGRPNVPTPTEPLDISDEVTALQILLGKIGSGSMSDFYLRSGDLYRVVGVGEDGYKAPANGHEGFRQLQLVTDASTVAASVDQTYSVFKVLANAEMKRKLFPDTIAKRAMAQLHIAPNLRTLDGLTETPVMRPDGSILNAAGYDPATRLLYLPGDLSVPMVPEAPSAQEVTIAWSWVWEMIKGFPFVTPDDRAAFLGEMFLPLLTKILKPPFKVLAIDAHSSGTGKTLLAWILRCIHHGPGGGTFHGGIPGKEEFAKLVTTIMATGSGIVHFDNVRGIVGGEVWESLLTSAVYSGRLLGGNTSLTVKNDRPFVLTGNNIQIAGDMTRRVLWSRIDAGMERPEDRVFDIDLERWVPKHRAELLWSLLTIARAWSAAGRPLGDKTTSDSFGETAQVIRGVLGVLCQAVPHAASAVGVFDAVQARVVTDDDAELTEFLHTAKAWQDAHNEGRGWTAGHLLDASRQVLPGAGVLTYAFPPDTIPGSEKRGGPTKRSTGNYLRNWKGRPMDGLVLRAVGDEKRSTVWKIFTV